MGLRPSGYLRTDTPGHPGHEESVMSTTPDRDRTASRPAGDLGPLQKAARIVGVVFVLVGMLGFVPGVTTGYGSMTFANHHSAALLLGLFQVSVLHNLVHLLFGVAGLALSRTRPGARSYLVGGGVVYLLLWVHGLVIDKESPANVVPVNAADDWLHLLLGAGMLALGLTLARRRGTVPDGPLGSESTARTSRAHDAR